MLARVFATATCPDVCPSVCHTPLLCLAERKQDRDAIKVWICNDVFIANFLLSVTVKEFWKSVIIWQCYGQEFDVLFLLDHGVYIRG